MKDIDDQVLEFYTSLPFNIYEDPSLAIQNIKNFNLKKTYPFLIGDVNVAKTIIDVGCGGGWLANVLAYHFNKSVTGLDFNPVALEHAKKISEMLNNKNEYIAENIFTYKSDKKFDLIISMGVLHHTRDCMKALEITCNMGKPGSKIYIGLYHKYGRKPFLEKFNSIENLKDEDKLKLYKSMHPLNDKKHQLSWFRDQVLHPHETQHVLKEVLNVFKKHNYKFIGTSINKFDNDESLESILNKEKKLYEYAAEKIKNNIYYPGFFIVGGEKIND
tara:strand:+ start:2138 stop:2959 length:822 start_codon:yes stop_codon:yes gene_type:complete